MRAPEQVAQHLPTGKVARLRQPRVKA